MNPINIDSKKWERFSNEGFHPDNKACECDIECSCYEDDLNRWLLDVTHVRKFTPKSVMPVNRNGAIVLSEPENGNCSVVQGLFI